MTYDQLEAWSHRLPEGLVLRGRRWPGAGAPIQFLHGNGLSGGVYWPLLQHLAAIHAGLTLDLEGHGESDRPARYAGSLAQIPRVLAVMAARGLEAGVIGMGHSFGAALSLRLADAAPERFRALVLLDPILLPRRYWWGVKLATALGRNPIVNAARRRRSVWPDREALTAHLKGRGVYRGWSEPAFAHFVEYATEVVPEGRALRCPPWLEAAIFAEPFWPWAAIARLELPTLILVGEASYPFFPRALAKIRKRAPQVQIDRLPGGHCFMLEHPEATAARILRFLEGLNDGAFTEVSRQWDSVAE